MRLKEVFIFGALVAALTLSACTTTQPVYSYSVTVTVEELQQQKHISKEMVVPLGERFRVTLASTPSTGFRWFIASDPAKLMQIAHQTLSTATTSTPPLGSGGQEAWTFEAVGKGRTIVWFEYSQPLEDGERGAWTLELTVTVQ